MFRPDKQTVIAQLLSVKFGGFRPPRTPWNSPTGTRTPVVRVKAEYPDQLDYRGVRCQKFCITDSLTHNFIFRGDWNLPLEQGQHPTRNRGRKNNLSAPHAAGWNVGNVGPQRMRNTPIHSGGSPLVGPALERETSRD